MASTLRSYGNNTIRERGIDIEILCVYIAILAVDIAILGIDIAILGVDIAILGVDIAILGVDIAILGVDIVTLGVAIAILRRQEKGWGLQRGEEGGVSRARRLEAGWSTREFGKEIENAYLIFNNTKRFFNEKYVESVGPNAFLGSDSLCDFNYDIKLDEVTSKFDEVKNDFGSWLKRVNIVYTKLKSIKFGINLKKC